MNRVVKKTSFALVICAITIGVALAILSAGGGKAALPNPNGYDELIRAAQLLGRNLEGADLAVLEDMDLSALRPLLLTNAEVLKITQAALNHECRVPVKNSPEWCRAHLGELIGFRGVMRLFCLAGRLAELEGRTNDALTLYVDCVRFAHAAARGGIIIDSLAAQGAENRAFSELNRIRDSLDAAQNRRVAKELEQLDSRRAVWGDFSRMDLSYTIRAEFKAMFSLEYWALQGRIRARFHAAEFQRRQHMLGFALRAYELETGKKADDLSKLVPSYLRAIPTDPVTGKPIAAPP